MTSNLEPEKIKTNMRIQHASFNEQDEIERSQTGTNEIDVDNNQKNDNNEKKELDEKERTSLTITANSGEKSQHLLLSQMKYIKHENATELAKEVFLNIKSCMVFEIPHLIQYFPNLNNYPNTFFRTKYGELFKDALNLSQWNGEDHFYYNSSTMVQDDHIVLADIVRKPNESKCVGFIRAGSRSHIYWNPVQNEVIAGIVTAGGLCPGMNTVIAELVKTLYYNYSVDKIYGFRWGLKGLANPEKYEPILLTPKMVHGISEQGGTILGTARGGYDANLINQTLSNYKITHLYLIGGDGTHRAAKSIYDEQIIKFNHKISIIAIPKTIDNDIGIIDRSFGFATAVEEAERAINSAAIEAKCNNNGVGLVKLMGRHAGFVAAYATLANTDVDLCLIPEVPFEVNGNSGVCSIVEELVKNTGQAVIVVAEGAGAHLLNENLGVDQGGNKKLSEIGLFLKSSLENHFEMKKMECAIKYHDPSYMIRSVKPNAWDTIYCLELAQNAVHAAMAGFTGLSVGRVNSRSVLIPLELILRCSPTTLNPKGHTYERVLRVTHQRAHCMNIPSINLTPIMKGTMNSPLSNVKFNPNIHSRQSDKLGDMVSENEEGK